MRIMKTHTTLSHPQSDGMVERFNRTFLNHMKSAVDEYQTDNCIPLFLNYHLMFHLRYHPMCLQLMMITQRICDKNWRLHSILS